MMLWAIWLAGLVALTHGRLTDAAQLYEAAVTAGREANDTVVMHALVGRAFVATLRGDFDAARAALTQSLAEAQDAEVEGDIALRLLQPMVKWSLGTIELATGDAAQARESLGEVVNSARTSVIPRYAAVPLVVLAEAQLALGTLDDVTATLDEAVSLAQAGAMVWVIGRANLVRAKLRAHAGDLLEAESLAHEALKLAREAGDQMGLVEGVELMARLAAEQDSNKEAIRLWAAAETQRDRLGYRFCVDRSANEATIAQAKSALGPDESAAAWAEGAKLSMDEAIAYTVRGRGERRRPTTGWASLTPSELEVVRLVGQHLSNPEIAARLFVSRATVKTHLVHIFAKLGIDSRSELVAEVVKRQIALEPSKRS